MKKIALFPGSFDPFTTGHYHLVERILQIADQVIIAVGINQEKKAMLTGDERLDKLRTLYAASPCVQVMSYSNLTAQVAQEMGASYIVRGVRSPIDFDYECRVAEVNRLLTGIETIFLPSLPQYAHISSSMVRELKHHQQNIQPFLPPGYIL